MLHGSAAEELYKLQGGIGKDKLEMSRKEMWVDGIWPKALQDVPDYTR